MELSLSLSVDPLELIPVLLELILGLAGLGQLLHGILELLKEVSQFLLTVLDESTKDLGN